MMRILLAAVAASFLAFAAAPALAQASGPMSTPASAAPSVEVWKAASCGCCGGWVRHMRAEGFAVVVHEVDDVQPVKDAEGVPGDMASCHTSVVTAADGARYVVEGHVPAEDVRRLLSERPALKGIAAPGMPASSPGMDRPGQPYEVMTFGGAAGGAVYARH